MFNLTTSFWKDATKEECVSQIMMLQLRLAELLGAPVPKKSCKLPAPFGLTPGGNNASIVADVKEGYLNFRVQCLGYNQKNGSYRVEICFLHCGFTKKECVKLLRLFCIEFASEFDEYVTRGKVLTAARRRFYLSEIADALTS